jgi:hypothetical protein
MKDLTPCVFDPMRVLTPCVFRRGSTVLGHALSKHSGRNPEIWGKMTGSMKTWHDQAMRHADDIIKGPGDFVKQALFKSSRPMVAEFV